MNPIERLWQAVAPAGRRRRRLWSAHGKAHVEVRGAHTEAHGRLVRELDAAFARIDGVDWVELIGATGRLVVDFDEDAISVDDIVSTVADVEAAVGVDDEPFPDDRPGHPGDWEPLATELIALGADTLSLGFAVAGRAAQLARIPVEVAGVVPLIQSHARLRGFVEDRLGTPAAHLLLATLNAGGQALSQGPLGLVVDGTLRVTLASEDLAHRRHWETIEPAMFAAPSSRSTHHPPNAGPRPEPLAPGPVERYSDRAGVASIAGFALAAATTRNWQRAAGTLMAAMPKAAVVGREAFAAHLGRALARRGAVVLDQATLRRLDRVDCVVLDRSVLLVDTVDAADTTDATEPSDPVVDAHALMIVDAARRGGHMVVVAGVGSEIARAAGADLYVDGDEDLLASVRMLQHDGCGVLLVAHGNVDALHAADCGVGVHTDGPVPWGADVVCRDIDVARFVVESSGAAYEASRQSAALALGGSSVAALLAMTAPLGRANARALTAVNVTALAALVNGTRVAFSLDRRPAPHVRDRTPWHALEPSDVLLRLATDGHGLDADEARRRLPEPDDAFEVPGLVAAIASELVNPFTPILAAAAGLSVAAGSALDAILIAAVAGTNAAIGGVQRHRVESAVSALEAVHDRPVRVRRNGELAAVPVGDVVAGDVIVLEAGEAVPADARLLEARSVEADESSLTGESLPVSKHVEPVDTDAVADRASMLYAGTAIAAGRATAVVIATGDGTEVGAAANSDVRESGGVEARLRQLTTMSIPMTVGAGAVIAGANFLRGQSATRSLQVGTSLAVAAVPEGLPLLATAAQLSAARRLAERGALVRNARAVEALGRLDVVCCDKTGTLTEGRITLQRVSDGVSDVALDALDDDHRGVLAAAVRASPRQRANRDFAHPTDRAVVEGAAGIKVTPSTGQPGWRKRTSLPFEPSRGYHAVIGAARGRTLLSVKGAPEVVIPRCDVDESAREVLEQTVERMAREGLRVLAVAEREASDRRDLDDERVTNLNFLGFVGLADPVRPTAAAAVQQMRDAGVSTVMVTGDHPSTAEGIARELGILNGRRVLTGTELERLDDDALRDVLDDVSVFARVTPSHKVRIVAAYQSSGRAVAMTGDGANDAPAIGLADVGVALGERATAAARQTADLVVPDGRIETLIDAVAEGRAMWASVRDALAILLGGNLGEVAFTLLAGMIGGGSALSPRQLLLVNLLTDGLPAIAIAVRPPNGTSPEQLLAEGPEASLGRPLELAIAHRAVVTAAAGTAAWLLAAPMGPRRRTTAALVGVVGAQLVQTALSGSHDRRVLLTAAGSAAVLAAIIETPGLSQIFGCAPIGPVGWAIGCGSAAVSSVVGAVAPQVARAVVDLRPASGGGTEQHPATVK